jgi:EvpB/VC_A0108, tail sheath N-terminal domain/EvpB/VC_A0108, tail sheath gpW/gp25-like domain
VLAQAADTPGATPFGLLISDFTFGGESEDVHILQEMARLGAAAHVPFAASADWRLFGHSNFKQVAETTLLRQIFDTEKYTLWRHLGDRPESRYIGLVLPQVLLRLPYEGYPSGEKFACEEETVDTDNSKFLWGSAAWAFAARQASDFDRYGWFGAERTPDDLGELTDLPRLAFRTDDGDVAWLGPVEVALSDTRYLELRSLGLIPICQIADTNRATFFETWSLHKPNIVSDTDEGTAYVAVGLDCVLCVSRIAHYLRSILQTERQRFSSVRHCEEYLRNWITPYVVPEYAKGSSFEVAFPLLAAEFHIVLGPEPARPALLQASLLPKQAAGTPPHPVEISIPIALPWSLAPSPGQPGDTLQLNAGAAVLVTRLPHSNGSPSGRDRFIHRTFAAEACIANRKLDIAILILEDLVQQIDRYSLYEWESPDLITRVWDLLRRCYLLTAGVTGADEQSTELLRKICRLDPSRVIE